MALISSVSGCRRWILTSWSASGVTWPAFTLSASCVTSFSFFFRFLSRVRSSASSLADGGSSGAAAIDVLDSCSTRLSSITGAGGSLFSDFFFGLDFFGFAAGAVQIEFRPVSLSAMGRQRRGSGTAAAARDRRPAEEPMEVDAEERPADPEEDEDDEEEEGGIRIGDIYLPPPPPPACTFESNGPRLVITHIENENFKSYLGKQVLGPFHKSFTSIVGPNGSGKSNVIDSMLFVFGYRAQKIRSKKISVLIHNSDNNENIDSCTVAVHFQKIIDRGDDDFEVVPNSQLVVARTAFRDNSSFYTVNGRRTQFKAVARLLRAQGIDLDHNRFLILQGEVEQISLMKPKALTEHETGMLEYLEDIVGSSRYKEPIELLSQRVEQLNEQRAEKLNRVKLVEKEKDELAGPKDEALAYIRLENKVTCSRNTLLQKHIYECSKNVEKAQTKKQEIDDGMADIKKQLEELAKKRQEKEDEMRKLGKEHDKLCKQSEEQNEKFKQHQTDDMQLEENLKLTRAKMKKLKTALKTDREKLEGLEKVPEENRAQIETLTEQKGGLAEERQREDENFQRVMASIKSETQQFQDQKDQLEAELGGLKETVNKTKQTMDAARYELDIYVGNEQSEKAKLVQLETGLETARQHEAENKRLLSELEREVPRAEQRLEAARTELASTAQELATAGEQLRVGRGRLEEVRSALQSGRGRGAVLSAVMEQKRNGSLPGVFGRLGDLGAIHEKYDVAISTACGPLDNIVVDSVDTAQQCIQFLKQNSIGTATFIALDKMEKWRQHTQTPIQTPENVPRLFDLVQVKDERVRTAFYYALRDTLVADDLTQATRIGYGRQRHRVVTLRGDLIETSGTMSGGGKKSFCGRMGTKVVQAEVTQAEVESAEADVSGIAQRVQELKRKHHQLEEAVEALQKKLDKMRMEQRKHTMDAQAAAGQLEQLERQIAEQREKVAQATPDPATVRQMEAQLKRATKEYEKAESAASAVEDQVKAVHAKIMEVSGGKVKAAQKKLDDATKKLEKVSGDIVRLGVAIKTAERNAVKCRDKIAAMETEQKEAEAEKQSLCDQREKLEETAAVAIQAIKELEDKRKEMDQQLSALKEERDTAAADEDKVKASKIEIDQEMEKFDGVIKENKARAQHWKKQLSKLELQSVPESDRADDDITELPQLSEEELRQLDDEAVKYTLTVQEEELSRLKPDLAALAEYRKKEEIYLNRVAELDAITSQRDTQRKYYDDLRKQRLNEFMGGFAIITSKLKEMYQMITLGGDAELELVDSLDPFSEGIVFSVRPPKKSWKNITKLSGGEKTLSSLALVFALHYYKPTPLYVMDEIDAALDFKNVSIVGNYIKDRTKNAQFIIISLRSQMFELADRLVGIYKTHNATKSVTINPALIGQPAAAAAT
ncbi:structural maintenance of chromosomes protein 4-like isoform X2 [Amphibalanus amphitrite]|uniref:structural maintenance of chromosomes protein 4-like isoform X2 n=2 Tax=Amphibalanus amphitrite TaxID=1232801 RepID=UPI001C92B071|nr:structural maintenance of chromosomes protein 4-like isoform X2 [Amphibalanus amphitrite]